ncbi:MAG: hypothetical protein NVV62_19435 [Terricaulis sp.]|nr:hypothetical protein [Terricaulis sp.]
MFAELQAIQSAASSLKTAGDIVNALISLGVKAEARAKVIELQAVIIAAQSSAMSAQASQMELLQRVSELEGELMKLENWEAEKQRYGLIRDSGGCMIYSLKQSFVEGGEEAHALCPNCYEANNKSYLQPSPDGARTAGQYCPKCKASFRVWGAARSGTGLAR